MCGSAVPCAVDHNIMAMETQKKKLKRQEESRDFFCVVSDAFSDFCTALIRGRSVVLGLLPALSATSSGEGTSSTSGLYGNAGRAAPMLRNPGCVV